MLSHKISTFAVSSAMKTRLTKRQRYLFKVFLLVSVGEYYSSMCDAGTCYEKPSFFPIGHHGIKSYGMLGSPLGFGFKISCKWMYLFGYLHKSWSRFKWDKKQPIQICQLFPNLNKITGFNIWNEFGSDLEVPNIRLFGNLDILTNYSGYPLHFLYFSLLNISCNSSLSFCRRSSLLHKLQIQMQNKICLKKLHDGWEKFHIITFLFEVTHSYTFWCLPHPPMLGYIKKFERLA